MKRIHLMAGMFCLGSAIAGAETIRLADGTAIDGELGCPTEITVKTAAGDRRVAFGQLPPAVQARYWKVSAEEGSLATATNPQRELVSVDEIVALANEVNLDTWGQVTAIGSFRDRPEKRGTGGLVVIKRFNAIEENWVSVYSPKDPVGQAGNWEQQLLKARQMQASTGQFMQKRWLEVFIKAAEAIGRRDSNEFAVQVRELRRSSLPMAALTNPPKFFTAK